ARLLVHQLLELVAVVAAQLDLGRRLRRIGAGRAERPAQEVGGEQQTDDLLAPVGQGLRQLDHAAQDLGAPGLGWVDAGDQPSGRVAFAVGEAPQSRQLLHRQGAAEGSRPDGAIAAGVSSGHGWDLSQSHWGPYFRRDRSQLHLIEIKGAAAASARLWERADEVTSEVSP